jgi:hypothetical protein
VNIAFHVPVWLLWVIGVPVGLALLLFLFVGVAFAVSFWNWPGW